MLYHQLGTSSLLISEIGFGCMSLGSDDGENHRILLSAIDHGINFFDTADLYQKGMNETSIGKALKGKRDQVILATKAGNQWREDGSGWDWNPSKKYIIAAAEKSLARLQTAYIDLYQLHGGTIQDPIDETIDAFETLKAQGKIRFYGISSIRPNVIDAYIRRSSIVSVMMQYSLLDRRPEESCLDLLYQHNIGVLCRGALAQGLLAGKAAKAYLNRSAEEVAHAAESIRSISGGERSAAQTAIRYALHHPAIISSVTGIRSEKQLDDAVKTMSTAELSPEEMIFLQGSISANRYTEHTV